MRLIEDADAIEGGEVEEAVGDPGGERGAHHVQDGQSSVVGG